MQFHYWDYVPFFEMNDEQLRYHVGKLMKYKKIHCLQEEALTNAQTANQNVW